ncbi:MAG: hypothetical protein ABI647_27075 [Gemmatimonadota bacterium]
MTLEHRLTRQFRLGTVCLLAAATVGCGKTERPEASAGQYGELQKRLAEYEVLHKRLADSAGTLDETRSQTDIALRATALAKAITTARADAKQGDIFTPEASIAIVNLIKMEYKSRPPMVREKREDSQEELPDLVPHVNEQYPTTYPLATFPPSLLPRLPKLPDALEYRIVTHYLILRDIESNVIIDFLPHAVP